MRLFDCDCSAKSPNAMYYHGLLDHGFTDAHFAAWVFFVTAFSDFSPYNPHFTPMIPAGVWARAIVEVNISTKSAVAQSPSITCGVPFQHRSKRLPMRYLLATSTLRGHFGCAAEVDTAFQLAGDVFCHQFSVPVGALLSMLTRTGDPTIFSTCFSIHSRYSTHLANHHQLPCE